MCSLLFDSLYLSIVGGEPFEKSLTRCRETNALNEQRSALAQGSLVHLQFARNLFIVGDILVLETSLSFGQLSPEEEGGHKSSPPINQMTTAIP